MHITWNAKEFCFELTFDKSNFQNDLEAAKGAKFKTTGPPNWIWYSDKVKALKSLRENKPASGLTISEEARAKFNELCIEEDKKEEVLKYAKDAKARLAGKPTEDERKAKREEREQARVAKGKDPKPRPRAPRMARRPKGEASEVSSGSYGVSPLKYKPPQPPSILCVFCHGPVYAIYERIEPLPACLWCEKTIVDEQGEESA